MIQHRVPRPLRGLLTVWLVVVGTTQVLAQQPAALGPQGVPVDSLVVEGNRRVSSAQILQTSGLIVGDTINYRFVQRAIQALFRTGQFDDAVVERRGTNEVVVLAIIVTERPILGRWAVRGADKVDQGTVRGKIGLIEGRPLDRAEAGRARAAIDSLYKKRGFYAAKVNLVEAPIGTGAVRLLFDITEGNRVAISQVIIDGNEAFRDDQVVSGMVSRPEGFWWFQRGEYSEERLDRDIREVLPNWYGDRGHIDFQVLRDTLIADTVPGKAILLLEVDEGREYVVGTFDIAGNRRYSVEEIASNFPFGDASSVGTGVSFGVPFSRLDWDEATERIRTLYANSGYIYSQVEPEESRRTGADGTSYLDLRWNIREGNPATINEIRIVGNDVTHERVIREQIVMLPGQTFNREALIRSYENISNLNFFQQPLPPPDVQTSDNGVDVNITFRVTERRTGNIQFGATLGQGTGIGGFIGLEEPNLFGKAKRGRLQWQFGSNINDFNLTYTDPAFRQTRISTAISLFNSRQRYTVGDLGRRKQIGGSLQVGFPLLGARYTRFFTTYGYQRISYSEGSDDLRAQFSCSECGRSSLGASVLRDTRIGLPFPVAGHSITVNGELNGGFLGGTGNYRKIDVDGRWYTPIGLIGGTGEFGTGMQVTMGLTAKSGFVIGDPGPFFTELYTMGGVQYGIPLRGYEEFSITPNGFDPRAGSTSASGGAFGESFAAFTIETGIRVSQALYLNVFYDAGNVYRSPRQYNPLRLFRSYGFGVAIISPLGPIGLDLGYGMDRVDFLGQPDPGWKVHFRLGNFF